MRAIWTYDGTPNDYACDIGMPQHSGQEVEVVSSLHPAEYDREEVGSMYHIRADDGWVGHAFMRELQHIG